MFLSWFVMNEIGSSSVVSLYNDVDNKCYRWIVIRTASQTTYNI